MLFPVWVRLGLKSPHFPGMSVLPSLPPVRRRGPPVPAAAPVWARCPWGCSRGWYTWCHTDAGPGHAASSAAWYARASPCSDGPPACGDRPPAGEWTGLHRAEMTAHEFWKIVWNRQLLQVTLKFRSSWVDMGIHHRRECNSVEEIELFMLVAQYTHFKKPAVPDDDPTLPYFLYATNRSLKNSITMTATCHLDVYVFMSNHSFLGVLWLCKVTARWPDLVSGMTHPSVHSLFHKVWSTQAFNLSLCT